MESHHRENQHLGYSQNTSPNMDYSNNSSMTESGIVACMYQNYLWQIHLGLQRRDRLWLIKEKRKLQHIISIYQQELKGPYAQYIRPEDITELFTEVRILQQELDRLCD